MWEKLKSFEPKDRENCLCGSTERYENCCKSEWPKHNFMEKDRVSEAPADELKYLRARITWYRLCHTAHTVPLMRLKDYDGWLLGVDIRAMHDFIKSARFLYEELGIIDLYPVLLGELSGAIADVRWSWCVSCEEALYHMVTKNDYDAARAVLAKYQWEDIASSELLEVYLDAYHEKFGHVDVVSAANKIIELTESESTRFHYRFLVAMQYFLLNEPERAEKLAREAIVEYEDLPNEKRDIHGRRLLGMAVMQLGQILKDKAMLRKAIELLVAEVDEGRYKSNAIAEIWMQVGDCYHMLGEFHMAEKLYHRSLTVEPTDLAQIYLARVQLALGRHDRAKEILNALVPAAMSKHNHFDYAIVRCDAALLTKNTSDIQGALELIKGVSTNDPYFKDLIQGLIVALYELQVGKKTTNANSILARINRYVTLNPNVAGIGVNLNAMIEDYLDKK
ncbi:tetratricopeptide repeat protein [Pseudomonas cucumis]|uniref:tetratricopeptide repeat protein n=1 Tax=Pseudomonas cucumis TaxID=2954082 RepID=UPI0027365C05|nr:tetratricopeptide repeat protein [Pseudomonas cucumis]WLG91586.1 tetratricopeptide repeat protein [Pseudomonas cucumis]